MNSPDAEWMAVQPLVALMFEPVVLTVDFVTKFMDPAALVIEDAASCGSNLDVD